jgi:hypothetical protein
MAGGHAIEARIDHRRQAAMAASSPRSFAASRAAAMSTEEASGFGYWRATSSCARSSNVNAFMPMLPSLF